MLRLHIEFVADIYTTGGEDDLRYYFAKEILDGAGWITDEDDEFIDDFSVGSDRDKNYTLDNVQLMKENVTLHYVYELPDIDYDDFDSDKLSFVKFNGELELSNIIYDGEPLDWDYGGDDCEPY